MSSRIYTVYGYSSDEHHIQSNSGIVYTLPRVKIGLNGFWILKQVGVLSDNSNSYSVLKFILYNGSTMV